MTKEELINKLNSILEDANFAKDEASYAEDKASNIDEYCSLADVTRYAEDASSSASECQGYLEEVTGELRNLIETFESGDELEEETAIYDGMISEVRRTTEEKLNSFGERLTALETLNNEFLALTNEIHSDLDNLEKLIKGDE